MGHLIARQIEKFKVERDPLQKGTSITKTHMHSKGGLLHTARKPLISWKEILKSAWKKATRNGSLDDHARSLTNSKVVDTTDIGQAGQATSKYGKGETGLATRIRILTVGRKSIYPLLSEEP